MTIRVQCPRGHLIANVEIVDAAMIPKGLRHGIVVDHATNLDSWNMHAKCRKKNCGYDGSVDYGGLRDELIAAVNRGDTEYRLTF